MCTLSWLPADHGYRLFFNRDESRVRGPEVPCGRRERDAVSFLAPLDSDQGGTWLAANEYGLTVAVLNRYRTRQTHVPQESRGQLVLSLATAESIEQLRRRIERADLHPYQPFALAATEPDAPVTMFEWDGEDRSIGTIATPGLIATSSAVEAGTERVRRAALAQLVSFAPLSETLLEEFHRSHLPNRGPLSPCMHREEAETRSLCIVSVDRDSVAVRHVPGPPCLRAAPRDSALRRRYQPSHSIR